MQPQELRTEDFSKYPPEARALMSEHLAVLQRIPLVLLPVILKEVIDYDWRFPAEQRTIKSQLDYLATLPPAALTKLMSSFSAVRLPAEIGTIDWVNHPQHFMEQLSARLWSTQQIGDYHEAAFQYQKHLSQVIEDKSPAIPRFTIVIVGKGVSQTDLPLFRLLRPHGALFNAVQPANALQILINFVKGRAQKHSEQYAHWYIDGGEPEPNCDLPEGVTQTSYYKLAPVALRGLNLTDRFIERAAKTGAVGPEAVESFMASLGPNDLGLQGNASDAVMRNFEAKVLTEGAGTQVFSTTFVQWAAREALRRAQPVTVLARFAPRQRMAPMNELLKRNALTQANDPEGSLVDADMGAYYTWINQSRLIGADQARFLAWYEGHNVALAIAPGLPRGTVSATPASVGKILEWMG